MGLGRRRESFGAVKPEPPVDYMNFSNTDPHEKSVYPMNGGYGAFTPPPAATSPVTATCDPRPEIAVERPMVFSTKENSDVFIYEYSDRLEYYVRTATCMYKFKTVQKP